MQTENRHFSPPDPKSVLKGFKIARIARKLGIGRSTFYTWDKIPLDYVIEIEAITGISRHDLRPDYYGPKNEKEVTV